MRISEHIEIGRPPEDVWAVVSDLSTHTVWRPSLVEFRQLSDGPLGVGTRIREVLRWKGRTIEVEDVVTAFDPPRRLGIHGGWKAADFDVDFALDPSDVGTRVTFDWSFEPKTVLLRVLTPFLGRTLGGATRDELERLKAYVER